MASHNPPPSSTMHYSQTLTPPSRPTRPRLSRGISSRKPAPPPVPPSLRDHPLLDAVAHGNSSGSGTSSSGASSSHASPNSIVSSRRSSVSASPHARPQDKVTIPLPSPTNLWAVPPRPSPPIAGPWSAPAPCDPEPVGDAMGLLDTVPAGSTVSVASPGSYPWHGMQASGPGGCPGHNRIPQGYEYMSMPLNLPTGVPRSSRRHAPPHHPHSDHHNPARSPGVGTSGQRHNVGALHTHSPQPSPPVTPAAA